MSDSLFDFLGDDKKENLIASFLPHYIINDYSGSATLRELRKQGIKIGNQRFYRLWNYVKKGEQESQRVQFLSNSDTITEDILQQSNYEIPQNYRFIAKYSFTDSDGKRQTAFTAYDTDSLGKKSQIAQELSDYVREKYKDKIGVLGNVQVYKGIIR